MAEIWEYLDTFPLCDSRVPRHVRRQEYLQELIQERILDELVFLSSPPDLVVPVVKKLVRTQAPAVLLIHV